MTRKIFSKAARIARATTTVVGLAIMLALVFGAATTAIGATGGNFILGKPNAAGTPSSLTASIAKPTLTLINNSTDAAATALNITVDAGNPPLKVNATAGTATNLSAYKLDGLDSAAYQRRVSGQCEAGSSIQTIGADGAVTCETDDGGGKAPDSDLLDGKDSTQFANATHLHSGADITSGTVAEARIDAAIARDSEVNTALSGKANTTHQHSGADITSGTVEADRVEDGAGSNLNADQLDGKDSSSFGIRTEHNWARAHECDTPWLAGQGYNECAPVTVTVPNGKTYYASVWSTFSAKHSEGFGAFQRVFYCSAGKGPGISTINPCITPFGVGNYIELDERLSSASSSGESIPLSGGTYTFFTAISPEKAFGFADHGTVITKVMIRDATNGL